VPGAALDGWAARRRDHAHRDAQRERTLKLSLGQKLRVKLRNVDIRGGRVMVELL
jgi:hypothetical protein